MLELHFDINLLLIIIVGYILYKILINTYPIGKNKENQFIENFSNPSSYDPYDKKYKPVLKQNVDDICNRKIKNDCLPYSLNYTPSENENENETEFENPTGEIENFEGRNFLYAKQHSQIDNVGITKKKKVDIRPEPINPQLGVAPWTQSIVNINWSKDEKVLQNPEQNKNIWNRLT